MTILVSKRHRFRFYLTIILSGMALMVMGTIVLLQFPGLPGAETVTPKDYCFLIFAFIIYYLAFYSVYKYYKNVSVIKIDESTISFYGKKYRLNEIEHLALSGKVKFPFFIPYLMEAATLRFKDGQTRYIFDDLYENAWEFKSFLKQVVIDDNTPLTHLEVSRVEKLELNVESFRNYKGHQLLSYRGLLLWGVLSFCVFILLAGLIPWSTWYSITIISFLLFWFLVNSWLMHYFRMSQHYLVVKSHIYFWKTQAFRLKDIQEIVFESQVKMPNILRVITKDFKSRSYPAGTLRNKTWLELKEALERQGIKVRNECI